MSFLNKVTMERMPITIRPARLEDNERLSILGRETFWDSFAGDNQPQDMVAYLESAFSPSIQAAELAEPLSRFLIAEAGGSAVGYARLMETPAPAFISAQRPIQLARLYVSKGWLGRGVGAALMTACIADARRRQCDGIWLGVWEKNARAIRFYRQWGFSEMGIQPFLLGNDPQTDKVMWLMLKSPPPYPHVQKQARHDT
jgi:ribosomal protein S18 acetylase RimI-like enzyme